MWGKYEETVRLRPFFAKWEHVTGIISNSKNQRENERKGGYEPKNRGRKEKKWGAPHWRMAQNPQKDSEKR